jgi:hypothetical protein
MRNDNKIKLCGSEKLEEKSGAGQKNCEMKYAVEERGKNEKEDVENLNLKRK